MRSKKITKERKIIKASLKTAKGKFPPSSKVRSQQQLQLRKVKMLGSEKRRHSKRNLLLNHVALTMKEQKKPKIGLIVSVISTKIILLKRKKKKR